MKCPPHLRAGLAGDARRHAVKVAAVLEAECTKGEQDIGRIKGRRGEEHGGDGPEGREDEKEMEEVDRKEEKEMDEVNEKEDERRWTRSGREIGRYSV